MRISYFFLLLLIPIGVIELSLSQIAWAETSEAVEDSDPESPLHRDSRTPLYQFKRPAWGFELSSSLNAFGKQALTQAQGTRPAYALSIHFDYQPKFFQKYGVLGIGPSLALYPFFNSAVAPQVFSVWSAGGQIHYQARYFRNQWVVPVFGYALEYLHYNLARGPDGSVVSHGPMVGLWFLMNVLEPSSAAQFYIDQGVLRTYFVLEGRNFSAQNADLNFTGFSYYFGLRFEF